MKTDLGTKGLLLFVGSGVWALVLMHGFPTVSAKVATTPTVQSVVRTRKLEVVNANGKTNAVLTTDKNGAILLLSDANGGNSAILKLNTDGYCLWFSGGKKNAQVRLDSTGLCFWDVNGNPRVYINTDENGSKISIADSNGNPRALLSGNWLQLCDENGNNKAVLSSGKDGPSLYFSDDKGAHRTALTSGKEGSSLGFFDTNGKTSTLLTGKMLLLCDENGNNVASLARVKDGPGIFLSDEYGQTRAVLGVNYLTDKTEASTTTAPSTLCLYDKNGNVIYKAP